MAINNYIRPMLEVYQQLEVMVQLTQDRLAACIVGANYDLYRYGYEDLKPITPTGLVSGGSQVIPLVYDQDPSYEYEVDKDSLRLYAEGLLAHVGTTMTDCVVDKEDPFVLRAPANKLFAWVTEGDTLPTGYTAALGGNLEAEIGDTVLLSVESSDPTVFEGTDTSAFRSGIIMDLVGEPVAGSVATPTTTNTSAITELSTMGTFGAAVDTTFQIVVTTISSTTATVQVTDSASLYPATDISVSVTEEFDIPLGGDLHVKGKIAASAAVGDAIYVAATAPSVSTTKFNGLRLSVTPTALSKWETYKTTPLAQAAVCKAVTGWLDGLEPSITSSGVSWKGALSLSVQGTTATFLESRGNLYQQFRVLLSPDVTDDVYTIRNTEDVQKYFGTIAVENDIAYGCAAALEGSAGRAIYALRVRNHTAEAYTEALNKVETNASTYSFAILEEDMDVLQAAADFVEKRSHPENKKWCRALCGIDNPGEYVLASVAMDGNPIKADIVLSADQKTYLLELTEDTQFDLLDITLNGMTTTVKPGDKVELVATGAKYTIARVSSSRVLVLENGPVNGKEGAVIRLVKADTPVNAGEYVAAVAERLNNRRFTVVFCDRGTVQDVDAHDNPRTVVVPNRFLAATVAGIASAVVPQAPITRTEVTTIDAATRMYTQYTQLMLDDIAKHGVLLITQDVKNQPCYIRHQLTTETDKGSLYYEESCTRNLDNISYSITDILEQYIGRSNVTPSALRSITNSVTDVLNSFTQDGPNDLIGPSLINWTDLSVEQDPVFKDRVIIRVKLYLPLPLNNIKVYEMAYAATVTV